MPLFKLSCHVTVSAFTEVEADTPEAAVAEAQGRPVELHFNGSNTDPSEVWCVEEADGSPLGVHVDE